MGQVVRMSMDLAQESLNTLRELASQSNTAITTMAEVLKQAVATARFVRDISASGGKILISADQCQGVAYGAYDNRTSQ